MADARSCSWIWSPVLLIGAACSDVSIGEIQNHPPQAPEVEIVPPEPLGDDDLDCQVAGAAVDEDGDAVQYRFAWTLNAEEYPSTDSTISSSETAPGDVWFCVVTPSDGELDGPSGTASVQVLWDNSPPTAPEIYIDPSQPAAEDALSCIIEQPAVDPDGDPLTTHVRWLVDGAEAGIDEPEVSADRTSPGEEWTCEAWADDGLEAGAVASAAVIIAEWEVVCVQTVTELTSLQTIYCDAWTPPSIGRLRATYANPDASSDGMFRFSEPSLRRMLYVFSGRRDVAYSGETLEPWTESWVEINVDPADGALSFELEYNPAGGTEQAGENTFTLAFIAGAPLSLDDASFLLSYSSGPTDTTPADVEATVPAGDHLLVEAVQCGSGGGGHGLYADDGEGLDGILAIHNGDDPPCNLGIFALPAPADATSFRLVNEDDVWGDNQDDRSTSLYHFTP